MKALFSTLLFLSFTTALFATAEKKTLQLRIQAQYGSIDQTSIYFDLGISPIYTQAEDGPKEMNGGQGVPNLFSLSSDNVKCNINGYSPLTQSAIVGIGVLLDSSSIYTFSLSQATNFDSSSLIILEDRQLNVFTDLQTNFYQVQLTPNDTTGRFFLHVTKAVQFTPDTAGCSNNNGAISIVADSAIVWSTVSLLDTNGRVITSRSNAGGQFAFTDLAEGNYNVAFTYGVYSLTKTIAVSGTQIIASFTASTQNAAAGEVISFNSTTINTSEYVWSYGDSTIVTGVANPTYFYYTPGVYTVDLKCTNQYGCSADVQMTITVTTDGPTGITATNNFKGISITNLGAKTVQVMMNDVAINNAELQVYNMLGQAVYSSPVTAPQMEVSLNSQPAGVYLVSVKNGGKNITTKIYIN